MKHLNLFTLLLACLLSSRGAATAQEDGKPVHIREIYVPHEEFLERANSDPDGVIMELAEYRNLVLKGIVETRKKPLPELPPLDAVVVQAEHTGKLAQATARFSSRLDVRVTKDGWVSCPLDPLPPALGSVLVDGKPGWVVVSAPLAQQKKGAAPAPLAFLLLKGKGTHKVELSFSLAATEKEDRWNLKGVLPRAESARLILDVPGHAEAKATPPYLQTTNLPGDKGSRLALALGSSAGFSIDWRLKRALGESDSMLSALHGMTVIPRLDDPLFSWESQVTIQRRKTDILDFSEPEGARVVTVAGKAVHSWQRIEDGIRVLLNEPVMGKTLIRFDGILTGETAGEAESRSKIYTVGPPGLISAYSNSGYLAICSTRPERLEIKPSAGAVEVALSEGTFPSVGPEDKRCFSYTDEDIRVELTTSEEPRSFESRAAGLVRVLEGGVSLDAIYQVDVTHGSEYRFSLSLPSPWKIVHLEALARGKGSPKRNLSWEVVGPAGNRTIEIELRKAIDTKAPLTLSLRLDHEDFSPDIDWPQRQLELAIPRFTAASKSRAEIGVRLPDSMYAVVPDLPGWEAMKADALLNSRFMDFIEEDSDLVAGLSSTTSQAFTPIRITLNHRKPIGEYQALTHLLALEGRIRVRNDLRLAIVDRAIDELRLQLPIGVDIQIPVRGKGIKEVSSEEGEGTSSTRVIRYARPWTGTREIRLEYEVTAADLQKSGIGTRVPWIGISGRPEDPLAPQFGGEHGLVFQSLGAVKIEVDRGGELLNTDVDKLPELGAPWSEGRVLFAYRFKARSGPQLGAEETPASFKIEDFSRADVLGIISREMELSTIISPGGLSRTRLNAVVAYNKEHQHLEIDLPEGALLLSARVGGNPAPYVRKNKDTGLWQVPLPPLSYTQISLVYQRSTPLGSWGNWRERGPVFKDVPVIKTHWKVFMPEGYRFHLNGGNLHPAEERALPSPLPGSFLDLAATAVAMGRMPPHGVLDAEGEAWPYLDETGKIELENAAASTGSSTGNSRPGALAGQDLPPRQGDGRPGTSQGESMVLTLQPHGHIVELTKLGGQAFVVLGYRDLGWWRFSKRTVFALTLVLGAWLLRRKGAKAFWCYSGGGLFLAATFNDIAMRLLGWDSPFLFIPACEALALLLAAGLLFLSARFALGKITSFFRARAGLAAILAACVSAGMAPGGELHGQDEILIPYGPETIQPGGTAEALNKVYIPYEKFRALWLLANPQEKKDSTEAPADLVIGSGSYSLTIEEDTYRIAGVVPVMILTDKWVTLPLPISKSKLKEILVDGKVTGIAQKNNVPFISLRGKGLRKLQLEFTGPVEDRLGSFNLSARLLTGAAAHLQATLPPGAEPVSGGTPAGSTFLKTPEATEVRIDLGSTSEFTLGWTFPRIAGQQKARLESRSYSNYNLTLDGYDVQRVDVIKVAGAPVSALNYTLIGDWNITSVSSADLSEWSVTENDGTRSLNLFYSKPVQQSVVAIKGWASLEGAEEKQAAALSLIDALRQESFIGIVHDARRRWQAGILSNRRAPINALANYETELPGADPDRLYQFFDSVEGQVVSASAATGVADASTSAVFFLARSYSTITARTRYQVLRAGPLRQEINLPAGWEFRNVQGPTVGEWEVVSTADGPRLVIPLDERASNGTEITWSARRQLDAPQEEIEVPLIRTGTSEPSLRSEAVQLTIAAAEEIDVRVVAGSTGIEKIARTSQADWIRLPPPSRKLFDMRSTGKTPDYKLQLEVSAREGKTSARSVLFARAAENYIEVNSQVTLSVTGGLEDTFLFRLPAGVTQATLKTRNLKSLTTPDAEEPGLLQLTLTSGIVGQHSVALSYRLPRDQKDTPVTVRPHQLLSSARQPAGTEHFVGIVETGQVLTNPTPQGLEKVRISDFPYLPEGVASQSLHHAYRATRADWSLTLDPETLRAAETAQANIDLADLVTVIGSDGTIRTKAVYTIANRKLQFLRIRLPENTQLWGATLNGNPMIASQAQGSLQVPLKHVGVGDLNLEVGIVYSHLLKADLPSLSGSMALGAPLVLGQGAEGGTLNEVTVRRTIWRVEVPDGYNAEMSDGNMQEVVSSIQYASKVESNLEEIDRLTRYLESETAGGAGAAGKLNRRQRAQVNLSLKRLQQTLSDNVMDLSLSNQEGTQVQEQMDLQIESLQEQQFESNDALDRGRQAQKKLEDAIRKNEQQDKAAPGKYERAFRDKYNFRGNDWQTNPGIQQQQSIQGESGAGKYDLADLLYPAPFAGFRRTRNPEPETAVEKARAEAVTLPGLKPLPPSRVSQVNPALESPPAPSRATSLTFRRPGGEVRLVLDLSREGLWLRFISPALLLLGLGALWWRVGRKGQKS